MPLLPAAGTVLSYNGVLFDGATHVTVQDEFIPDDADRTTVYQRIKLHAKGIISNVAGQAGTNANLETLRHKLGAAGAELVFTGHGFGNDLTINQGAGGGKRDVKWGPHPKVLGWEPIGSYNACEVEWECVTNITPCPYSPSLGIMAINYGMDFKLNDRGYTTRTITGYVEIAQTRVGRTVPDTADAYRDAINPVIPDGFKREQSWKLSLDKSRVDFTITDTEIPSPNAYPAGVVKISGTHRIRVPKSMSTSKCTISLNIEMAADQSTSLAYAIWSQIVVSRLDAITLAGKKFIIDDINLEEGIFERTLAASINFRLLSTIKNLLNDSGLWTPLGTTWNQWALSMNNTFRNRGHAGLEHLAANDAIVDLCGGQSTVPWNDQQRLFPAVPLVSQATLRNTIPPPEESWLKYQAQMIAGRERPVIRQALLQAPDQVSLQTSPNDTGGLDFGSPGGENDILQESGRSRHTSRLVGSAIRAAYPIPKPSVTTIGGKTPVETHARFVQVIDTNSLGVPIYAAAWDIGYAMDNSPGTVLNQPNVKEGVTSFGLSAQPN